MSKFAGKSNINNIEQIKAIFYKLVNHTQRFIGRMTPEHFKYVGERLGLELEAEEVSQLMS